MKQHLSILCDLIFTGKSKHGRVLFDGAPALVSSDSPDRLLTACTDSHNFAKFVCTALNLRFKDEDGERLSKPKLAPCAKTAELKAPLAQLVHDFTCKVPPRALCAPRTC